MPINMNSSIGRSVLRGDELDQMTEEELSQAIATTSIFARTSPEHKMKIVRALQARGDVVATLVASRADASQAARSAGSEIVLRFGN